MDERTNAYGMNLYNRHGGHCALMGGCYDYLRSAIHFFQPYWRNWKTFADYITRLSYVLSRGRLEIRIADTLATY